MTTGRMPLQRLVENLARTERLPAHELERLQATRLKAVLEHHWRHTPIFANRLQAAGIDTLPANPFETLRALQPIRRADIQQAEGRFISSHVPETHLPTGAIKTSGSTGEPVSLVRTALSQLFWSAYTIRDHLWHKRDFGFRLAAIRANISAYVEEIDWGRPTNLLYRTGKAQGFPNNVPLSQQAAWLKAFQPSILLVYPNNLKGLLELWEAEPNLMPPLRHVRTLGETVSEGLRTRTQHVCSLPIEDNYSSQEAGTIAIQCPEGGLYHIMSECLVVEVLDDAGRPCGAGTPGRVVVTDLMNYAAPLVRYEIGDWAEPGVACACGRTLPTLKRILGRERNLMRLPDGGTCWPLVGFHSFSDVAPVLQFQFIQHTLNDIEFRVVTADPLNGAQEAGLAATASAALGHDTKVRITQRRERMPVGTNGKFEEFVCRIS